MVCGFASATVPVTARVAVSTNVTRSSVFTATSNSRPSGDIARPCGPLPTSIACVTRSVAASMTLTVEAPEPLTNTVAPLGVITMPSGPEATGRVAITLPTPVSMTLTVLSLKFPT